MLPVRCYTCGKVLGHLHQACIEAKEKMGETDDWLEFFEEHGIRRYCCRRVLMSHVPDPNYEKHYKLASSITILDSDTTPRLFLAR